MRLKKVSRVIFVILILIFIFSMLLWSIPLGRAASKLTVEDVLSLEKTEFSRTVLLPGNPFYFLKNWAWGIKKIFTTDKINWHLGFTASKLLDIRQLVEKNPDDFDRIQKAITYYEKASQELEQFINNSSSENKKNSLEKIVKNLIFYEKIFNNILSLQPSQEVKNEISVLIEEKEKYFIDFLAKSKDFDKILSVFNDAISNKRGVFSGLYDLYLVDILQEIMPDKGELIADFKDKLYFRSLTALNNANWIYGDSLKSIFDALLGNKKAQKQSLWDWNARSGQNELFAKILGDMNDSLLDNESIGGCLGGLSLVEKQITTFKDYIGQSKISSNIESFLITAEGMLKHAQERIESSENKYACNLIQNSQAMITNAWRLIYLANQKNIEKEMINIENQITDIKKIIEEYDSNTHQRLFDLIGQMEEQLISIKSSYDAGNFENALQKIDEFSIISNNFNFILSILNGNKIIAEELNVRDSFFSKDSLESFRASCLNREGSLIDRFIILPFCKLKNGEILSMK